MICEVSHLDPDDGFGPIFPELLFDFDTLTPVMENISPGCSCHRTDRGEHVLVEVLPSEPGRDQYKFIRMIETIIPVQGHPCLSKLVGYCLPAMDNGATFKLITSFESGVTLDSVITKNPIWWTSTAKSIALIGIVLGMIHLHAHDVMHRNLRPEKIVMTEDHHVKIHGFELSRLHDLSSTLTAGDVLGDPHYMAPEIWSPDADDYTLKVDVYSFGLILYEILVGRPVFGTMAAITLMNMVSQGGRAPIPDNVNQMSKGLIERCWNTDPKERPTFLEILDSAKEANFCFIDDVDSEQVAQYVGSVEACAAGLGRK
jgi:serine/threonine protein kinase